MSDHTPGPWRFSRELNVFEVSPADDDAPSVAFVVAAPDLQHSAFNAEYFADKLTKTKLPEWDQAFANARLIAAAPDLYAALEELVAADDAFKEDYAIENQLRLRRAVDAARAALALAKAKP